MKSRLTHHTEAVRPHWTLLRLSTHEAGFNTLEVLMPSLPRSNFAWARNVREY